MAISPSGRYVTPMVTYFKWFAMAAVTAFSCLPEFVKRGLVQWWLSNRKNLMLSSVDSVLKLLTPQSVNGCLTMAHDEMKEVVDPDEGVCYKIIPGLQSVVFSLHCTFYTQKVLKSHFGRWYTVFRF